MEDEDLTASLNSTGKGDDEEKTAEKKVVKKEKAVPKKKVVKESPVAEEVENTDEKSLDPREDFVNMLRDVKLTRGIEMISDVFFNGDKSMRKSHQTFNS